MVQPDETTFDAVKTRMTRRVRRLGYVVFMGGGLLIFIPMIIAVIQGIQKDEIWDPVSGQSVIRRGNAVNCTADARRLVEQSVGLSRLSSEWDGHYREWLARCKKDDPGLYDLLYQTRTSLQKRKKDAPVPD